MPVALQENEPEASWSRWSAVAAGRLRRSRRIAMLCAALGVGLLVLGQRPAIGAALLDGMDLRSRGAERAFGVAATVAAVACFGLFLPAALRWARWRRALLAVPASDGAACPQCGRALLDPARRADQADGAETMRCDRCARRWPLQELRERWRAEPRRRSTDAEGLPRWAASVVADPALVSPSPKPGVLSAVDRPARAASLFGASMGAIFLLVDAPSLTPFLAVPPLVLGCAVVVAGLATRVGEAPRCKRCEHALAPGEEAPSRCPECGASLRARGAIVRGARVQRWRVVAAGTAVFLLGVLLMLAPLVLLLRGGSAATWMPTTMLIGCAARGGLVHQSVAQAELARRTLSAEQELALAEAYLEGIRVPFNSYQVDMKHLLAMDRRGALPTELRQRWFRESVEIALDAPRRVVAGEAFELRLSARTFTGWNLEWTPLVAVGDVVVDGRTDSGHRSVVLAPADAWAPPVRGAPLAGAPPAPMVLRAGAPGTQRIAVQVWVAIRPAPLGVRASIAWGADGTPGLPDDVLFVEQRILERSVLVRPP